MISGFQASDIGQYGIEDHSWWKGSGSFAGRWEAPGTGTFSPFFNVLPGLFSMGYPVGPTRSAAGVGTGTYIPQTSIQSATAAAANDPAATGADPEYSTPTVGSPIWIDPEANVERTVFESPVPYQPDYRSGDTDWDWVYDRYVELNRETPPVIWDDAVGYFDTAVGWYDTLSGNNNQIAPSYPNMGTLAAAAAPAPTSGQPGGTVMAQGGACGPTGPRYGKICLATGEVTPLRRRRRRRLLTSGDLSDLAAAKSIIGGGAGLNALVVKAVRR